MAQQPTDEAFDLLGLSGRGAQRSALGRVADPLVEEQERAFRRNAAATGGVGGNVLSALAEQTRARTEANIGNRLNQLAQAGSPALNALQQLSQLQSNQGTSLANLASGEGTTLANTTIGQGSQLAQLAQNRGTALAGAPAFAAQQSPLTGALSAGLGGFALGGGQFSNPFSSGPTPTGNPDAIHFVNQFGN